MQKLLTVTVPAYNAAPWLEYNLNSLCLPELLPLLEILVIDDGSTDGTGSIADAYEARYSGAVRAIHKENGGHGSGINTGVREATGLFFKVVDADDWVEEKAFRGLLGYLKELVEGSADNSKENIRESNVLPDIVSSGFLWAYDNGSGNPETFSKKAEIVRPFSGVHYKEIYRFSDIADRLYLKMHNITYRTALLKEHWREIDEHCFYVDSEYITYPIPAVESIAFFPEFVYRYRIGLESQSMDPKKMRQNAGQYEQVLKSLLDFYRSDAVQQHCVSGDAGKRYIASIIARVVAARIRIYLSLPISGQARDQLKAFDQILKEKAPEIWKANQNKAVRLLRASGYRLYKPIAMAVQQKYLHAIV